MIIDALTGKRIVVTRPAHQSNTLVELLLAKRAEPIQMPLIEIYTPSDGGDAMRLAISELETFEWIVVTSVNGAAAIASEIHGSGRLPRIAAIGEATNRALGSIADFIPLSARGEVLAAEFPNGHGRVLLVQAEVVDGVVGSSLRSRGWSVTEVAAYQTRMLRPDPKILTRAMKAHALVLASGSAARSWVQSAGIRTPRFVVAVGQSTAKVSQSVGISVTEVATEPTPRCVVDTLSEVFSRLYP